MFGYKLPLAIIQKWQVVNVDVGDTLPKRGNRLTRTIARAVLAIAGWRIEGEIPNLPKLIFIGGPHTSAWDMVLGMVANWGLGIEIHWLAKQSIFHGPRGIFFRWLGGIPVNRRVSQGLVGQMAAEYNCRDKYLLVIMPEGTRARGGQWKTGYYRIAMDTGLPIVPVVIDYGHKAIVFEQHLTPSGNIIGDMNKLQSLFVGIQGKNSERTN